MLNIFLYMMRSLHNWIRNMIVKYSSRYNLFFWTLTVVHGQVSAGYFEPDAYEYAFSYADKYLNLRGRIDRLDLYEKDGTIYVRVVDYKSGSTTFDLNVWFPHWLYFSKFDHVPLIYLKIFLTPYDRAFQYQEVQPYILVVPLTQDHMLKNVLYLHYWEQIKDRPI